jgi:insertion element IS1 protein InsB
MSWLVVTERTTERLQPIVDDAPIAFQYCTDGLTTYEALNYRTGLHLVAEGKSQTYSVEGGNSDLRHYLARLAKKSRCFSRCMHALKRNIALFIQCWNRRQLFKHTYPRYDPPLRDFVSIWI